jgi:hypothetical protein
MTRPLRGCDVYTRSCSLTLKDFEGRFPFQAYSITWPRISEDGADDIRMPVSKRVRIAVRPGQVSARQATLLLLHLPGPQSDGQPYATGAGKVPVAEGGQGRNWYTYGRSFHVSYCFFVAPDPLERPYQQIVGTKLAHSFAGVFDFFSGKRESPPARTAPQWRLNSTAFTESGTRPLSDYVGTPRYQNSAGQPKGVVPGPNPRILHQSVKHSL